MEIFIRIIAYFVLLFAITIHEAAHGWTANKLGDPTAFHLGRVTLNPIPHIDPIGTVLMPIMMMFTGIPFFGWAKPVPVNPMNLRNPKKDNLWISVAGPLSNVIAGTGLLVMLYIMRSVNPEIRGPLSYMIMGRVPPGGISPFYGLALLLWYGTMINFVLAVFNMLPIPPLDGSGVLTGLLSSEKARIMDQIRPYGFLIIIGLLFIGFFNVVFRPIQVFMIKIVFG